MKKAMIVFVVFLLTSLARAENFDYDFLRMTQISSAEGFIWTKMTKEKKSSYLMGYENGYLNALAYHVDNKDSRDDAVSKLPSFYDAENFDRDSLISKLDKFYGQHPAYKVIPIPLAIRIIIYQELGIKSHVDDEQLKFFENMLNEAVSDHPEDNIKDEVQSETQQ